MINVSIIGANGYTGLELLQILSNHDQVKVQKVVSRSNASTKVIDIYSNLFYYKDYIFSDLNYEEIANSSEYAIVCLPHGASAETCKKLLEKGLKVIDLSADFRYKNLDTYTKWYKIDHPAKELIEDAVYGLPEINKKLIKKAKLIGNPGCYTTCSIIPLYPLLKDKLISSKNIIIDAKSGTSGAGRKAEIGNLFTEVNESFKAYAVTTHRHTSEIEEILSANTHNDITLSFTPHLLPIQRGILSTIYTDISENVTAEDVYETYMKYYKNEPFVYINKEGVFPSISSVKHSNYISIGFKIDKRLNKLIIISCLDNLMKGASGQAVQNLNIMAGLEETYGLKMQAKYI